MRVLFVCSGNSQYYDVASFIRSQGDSLQEKGIEVSYFLVRGRGARNYMKSVGRLREYLKNNKFDLIHAHYSFCGWVAVLGGRGHSIVLSLMGDDAVGTPGPDGSITLRSRLLASLAYGIQPFVSAIISKSPNLERVVYRKDVSYLLPNGVQLERFRAYEGGCREELGLDANKRYVLFLGNTQDPNKNYALAASAVNLLNRPDVELINPFPIPHETVVKYLNSADVFVLCSFSEGSPNVVKEAMACGCPLVATDVGDVAWLAGDTPGCYVSNFEPRVFAEKLSQALDYAVKHGRTAGRERLLTLGLDAGTTADKLIDIYRKVLKHEAVAV